MIMKRRGWLPRLAGAVAVMAAMSGSVAAAGLAEAPPAAAIPVTQALMHLGGAQQKVTAPVASTTRLTSSHISIRFGQSVTFTATVSGGPDSPVPGGIVTFEYGALRIGSARLSAGKGHLTSAGLAPGAHSVTAVYGGDADDLGSTSPPVQQSVSRGIATLVLRSSAKPSLAGQPVTFTATLTSPPGPPAPTGMIEFLADGHLQAQVPLTAKMASWTTSSLSAGKQKMSVVYSGDSDYGSAEASLTQPVVPKNTRTTLSSSSNPAVAGQAVTFTATVTPSAPGTAPTGLIIFSDGATVLGKIALSAAGQDAQATYVTAALAPGTHGITAAYVGSGTYTKSKSHPVLDQVVTG
jgi:hypothetical protein